MIDDDVYLTRFEACHVVGMRATLLSQGASPMVTKDEIPYGVGNDYVLLALLELKLRRIRATVMRETADGRTIEYHVDRMVLPLDMDDGVAPV